MQTIRKISQLTEIVGGAAKPINNAFALMMEVNKSPVLQDTFFDIIGDTELRESIMSLANHPAAKKLMNHPKTSRMMNDQALLSEALRIFRNCDEKFVQECFKNGGQGIVTQLQYQFG